MMININELQNYVETMISDVFESHMELDLLFKSENAYTSVFEDFVKDCDLSSDKCFSKLSSKEMSSLLCVDRSILKHLSKVLLGSDFFLQESSDQISFIESFFSYEIQQIYIRVIKSFSINLSFEKDFDNIRNSNVFINSDSFYTCDLSAFNFGNDIGKISLCLPEKIVELS